MQNGKNKESRYDEDGYDENGFNQFGIHKITGRKFDEEGYDKRGFNIDATAVDLSKDALAVTEKNVENLVGIKALNNTFHIIESDMFSNINNNRSYDIIVSNPPYIPTRDIEKLEPEVRDYDPIMALDGDTDGLRFYRRIIEESSNYLNNGFIAFEIGYNQGDDVKSLLEEKGYKDIHIYKDLGGLDRVIIGRNN